MSNHSFGNIEFERDPDKLDPALTPKQDESGRVIPGDARPPETGDNRETVGYGREHYGEPGPQSAPDGRQTDELAEFERKQQPVTGHQDRRHK